jgi:mannose-6-phosphate isomerase-like protein (cupin superfamily)
VKITSLAGAVEEPVSHDASIRKRVLLRRGDVPGLTQLAQARFAPGQVASLHAHADMHEVFLVDSGVARFTIDGIAHRLEPGACIAIAPGERHEVANDGDIELVLTYFGIAP